MAGARQVGTDSVSSTMTSQLARTEIDPAQHLIVDSQLKILRTTARSYRHALQLFVDEMCFINRLHYKNKNQHRAAKFWLHFTETIRWCKRDYPSQLNTCIHNLRAMFWDGSFVLHPYVWPRLQT